MLTCCHSYLLEIQLVEERTKDPGWKPVLTSLSPAQYGRLMSAVNIDFNQARIAEIVAQEMSSVATNQFRCDHVVEALKNLVENGTLEHLIDAGETAYYPLRNLPLLSCNRWLLMQ